MLDLSVDPSRALTAMGCEAFDVPGTARLTAAPPEARWSLRIAEQDANDIAELAGFDLTGSINTARVAGRVDDVASADGSPPRSFRLGPDEWLLTAPAVDADDLAIRMSRTLANRTHGLVDVSDRNVTLFLDGPQTRAILNTGCPLDLSEHAFPVGMATRTVFAKAEIVLHRMPGEGAFELQIWRSFARYASRLLGEAATLQAAIDALGAREIG